MSGGTGFTMSKAVAVQERTTTVEVPVLGAATMRKPVTVQFLAEQTSKVREAKTLGDDIAGGVMWSAGLLVANAVDISRLASKDDGAPYSGQGDYAKALGFSESYANRLVRLGRAVIRHGVREGSEAFTMLASQASNARFASTLGVKVDTYTTEKAKIDADFKQVLADSLTEWKSTGRLAPVKRQAQIDDGSKGGDKGTEGKQESETPSNPQVPTQILASDLVAGPVRDLVAGLHLVEDDEAADVVHAALLEVVKADRKRRRTLAAAEAKRAQDATPEAPAEEPQDATPEA